MKIQTDYNRLYQGQVEHNKFMRNYWRSELAKARFTIQALAEIIRKDRTHPDIHFLNQN
mgnify:CR=1 FL=1